MLQSSRVSPINAFLEFVVPSRFQSYLVNNSFSAARLGQLTFVDKINRHQVGSHQNTSVPSRQQNRGRNGSWLIPSSTLTTVAASNACTSAHAVVSAIPVHEDCQAMIRKHHHHPPPSPSPCKISIASSNSSSKTTTCPALAVLK